MIHTIFAVTATFAVAALGGKVARHLHIPAGALLGAIVFVALYQMATGMAFLPLQIKTATQIISGLFVGTRVTRRDAAGFVKLFRPAAITIAGMVCGCILLGLMICRASDLDVSTALLGSAPGGIADITLISMDAGADTPAVTVMQVVRLSAVVGLFPPVLNTVIRKRSLQVPSADAAPVPECSPPVPENIKSRVALTLANGAIAGSAGAALSIPAGPLLFSLIAGALQNILFHNAWLPPQIKTVAQTGAGALIGCSVTASVLFALRGLLLPLCILLPGYLAINLALAWVLHRFGGLDPVTAFYSCTPGGASDISLMADDFGANAAQVSVIQIARSVFVIAIYSLLVLILEP